MADAGHFDCVIDMVGFRPDEAKSAVRAFAGRTGQYIYCSTVDVYTKRAGRYPVAEDGERGALPSFPYAYNKGASENLLLQRMIRIVSRLRSSVPRKRTAAAAPRSLPSGTASAR